MFKRYVRFKRVAREEKFTQEGPLTGGRSHWQRGYTRQFLNGGNHVSPKTARHRGTTKVGALFSTGLTSVLSGLGRGEDLLVSLTSPLLGRHSPRNLGLSLRGGAPHFRRTRGFFRIFGVGGPTKRGPGVYNISTECLHKRGATQHNHLMVDPKHTWGYPSLSPKHTGVMVAPRRQEGRPHSSGNK